MIISETIFQDWTFLHDNWHDTVSSLLHSQVHASWKILHAQRKIACICGCGKSSTLDQIRCGETWFGLGWFWLTRNYILCNCMTLLLISFVSLNSLSRSFKIIFSPFWNCQVPEDSEDESVQDEGDESRGGLVGGSRKRSRHDADDDDEGLELHLERLRAEDRLIKVTFFWIFQMFDVNKFAKKIMCVVQCCRILPIMFQDRVQDVSMIHPSLRSRPSHWDLSPRPSHLSKIYAHCEVLILDHFQFTWITYGSFWIIIFVQLS